MATAFEPSPDPVLPRPRSSVRAARILGLCLLCAVSFLIPALYLLGLLGFSLVLGWMAMSAVSGLVAGEGSLLLQTTTLFVVAGGGLSWLHMVQLVSPKRRHSEPAMLVTDRTQPRLRWLVDRVYAGLGLSQPDEIWLGQEAGVASNLVVHPFRWMETRHQVVVGTLSLAVDSERSWVARAMRQCWRGEGVEMLLAHLLQVRMNSMQNVLPSGRMGWAARLERRKEGVGRGSRLWRGASCVPYELLTIPFVRLGSRLLGSYASDVDCWLGLDQERVRLREESLESARQDARGKMEEWIGQGRLPNQLTTLWQQAVDETELRSLWDPEEAGLVLQDLSIEKTGAEGVDQFDELGRLLTRMTFHRSSRIDVSKYQWIRVKPTAPESEHARPLAVLRRYFGGLAHPERCAYGLVSGPGIRSDESVLWQEIGVACEGLQQDADTIKAGLAEWERSWVRIRDLEASLLLSLAGLSDPDIDGPEAERSAEDLQRELSEEVDLFRRLDLELQRPEALLESRLSAALGLLWWSSEEALPDDLRKRREALAEQVGVFEALAGVLPLFRELLTVQFSFQVVQSRRMGIQEPVEILKALQSVVPRMRRLTEEISRALDGAVLRSKPGKAPVRIIDQLLPKKIACELRMTLGQHNVAGMVDRLSLEATSVVIPFVERFHLLYHQAYAWLAETAEQVERSWLERSAAAKVQTGSAASRSSPRRRSPVK